MKGLHKYLLTLCTVSLLSTLTACGKDDDKLILVTTERSSEAADLEDYSVETTEVATTEATTESLREEASDTDKALSIEQLMEANNGDSLIAKADGYTLDKKYISSSEGNLDEHSFFGLDQDGRYIQVFSTSDGYTQILDNYNKYWYVTGDGELYILISPEDGAAGAAISYQHKYMIFPEAGISDAPMKMRDVYREQGKLVAELQDDVDSDPVVYKYYLSDDYTIDSCDYMTEGGSVFCTDTISVTGAYNIPADIKEMMASEDMRMVTFTYPNNEGYGSIYYVPKNVPVKVTTTEFSAYADEALATPWTEEAKNDDGTYGDITIYLAK